MSNSIRTRPLILALSAVLLASCTSEATSANANESDAPGEELAVEETAHETRSEQVPATTGAPAQPTGDAAISESSRVISMEELSDKFPDNDRGPGCFITFAYIGYPPETQIWNGEPCSAIHAFFRDRESLEEYNDWERLDEYDKKRFSELPDGKVFYVEGQFAASIYPIDYNHLTYEVVVTD